MKIMPGKKNGYINTRYLCWKIKPCKIPQYFYGKNGTHTLEINLLRFQAYVNSAPE